jgi:hypothetical protein
MPSSRPGSVTPPPELAGDLPGRDLGCDQRHLVQVASAPVDQSRALDAVRRLCAQRVSATPEWVAALIDHVDDGPADVESVRAVLEELATSRELGRVQSAAHLKGQQLEWTTSYFPTHAS